MLSNGADALRTGTAWPVGAEAASGIAGLPSSRARTEWETTTVTTTPVTIDAAVAAFNLDNHMALRTPFMSAATGADSAPRIAARPAATRIAAATVVFD